MRRYRGLLLAGMLVACKPAPDPADVAALDLAQPPNAANSANETTATDGTDASEAALSDTSDKGAADVVRAYYDYLGKRQYAAARGLWFGNGQGSGMRQAEFAASNAEYTKLQARVDIPKPSEGAAGSIYIEVPVTLSGTMKDGSPFEMTGSVQLRRVNDVPGSTPVDRRWHIIDVNVRPTQ